MTQRQEARAGFDAATRLGSSRLLLLQFKAGRRLSNGQVRFRAPHHQLVSLKERLAPNGRYVFYVLPDITQTSELDRDGSWILSRTWLVDVEKITHLGLPLRKSQYHHITLEPQMSRVVITSEPRVAPAMKATGFVDEYGYTSLGRKFSSFELFWSCARLLGRGAVAVGLPTMRDLNARPIGY